MTQKPAPDPQAIFAATMKQMFGETVGQMALTIGQLQTSNAVLQHDLAEERAALEALKKEHETAKQRLSSEIPD